MAEPMIYKAITEVMKDVGAIGKDKTNTQQGWKFRGIDGNGKKQRILHAYRA